MDSSFADRPYSHNHIAQQLAKRPNYTGFHSAAVEIAVKDVVIGFGQQNRDGGHRNTETGGQV